MIGQAKKTIADDVKHTTQTFESLVHGPPELVEPAPLVLAVRDGVAVHPAAAREPVEVLARVCRDVHTLDNLRRWKYKL